MLETQQAERSRRKNSYNDGREVTHPGILKALAHAGILQRG